MAHTYEASPDARYLVILPPRLRKLIADLFATPDRSLHADIFRRYSSEILE